MNFTEERVVLVNDAGESIGTALKSKVHHADTPLHQAFSIFLFDEHGRALFQQRALHKATWPGVWSNACCGHPLPDETLEAAAHRRLQYELGIESHIDLEMALPDFRYRAQWHSIWENELCPVFVGTFNGPIQPNPAEVAATRWIDWASFAENLDEGIPPQPSEYSPWSRWEAAELIKQATTASSMTSFLASPSQILTP